jgi:hypothetical protein
MPDRPLRDSDRDPVEEFASEIEAAQPLEAVAQTKRWRRYQEV